MASGEGTPVQGEDKTVGAGRYGAQGKPEHITVFLTPENVAGVAMGAELVHIRAEDSPETHDALVNLMVAMGRDNIARPELDSGGPMEIERTAPLALAITEDTRRDLVAAMGLLTGHGHLGSAAAIQRVLDAQTAPAAAPVVLPEPDAAVNEVMGLVKEVRVMAIGHGIRTGGISTTSDQSIEDSANLLRELEASIETKLRALLATGGQAQAQAHAVEQEPFGYFKAEPFGWTDCGPDDEGAVALYERPQAQADARDAGRWRMASLIHSEMMKHPDIRAEPEAASAYMKAVHDGVCFEAAIDSAIAAAKGE